MDGMKLVEVPVSDLADAEREFYWANYRVPTFNEETRIGGKNEWLGYYQHLERVHGGGIKAVVWERV